MTKLSKEDKNNIMVGGYLKKDRKICPKCVKDSFDEEDLDWIVGVCKENKVICNIEICNMHKLKQEEEDKYGEDIKND